MWAGGPHLWGQETGNSWRTGRDVFAVWDEHTARSVLKLPGYLQSVMTAIEDLAEHHPYAGPGGFNDPDMLVVGLDGCARARADCCQAALRAGGSAASARLLPRFRPASASAPLPLRIPIASAGELHR